jgi:hypothetical protein
MNRKKEIKRKVPAGYSFERWIFEKEIRGIVASSTSPNPALVIAALTVGVLKIEAVIFAGRHPPVLRYEVFVKHDPHSREWICYDSPEEAVRCSDKYMEKEMLDVLCRVKSKWGLSFTECNFKVLDGKRILRKKAKKPAKH